MRPRGRSTRRSSIADRTVTAATNTHAATLGVGTAETATASTTAATATATAEEEEEEEEAPAAVAAAARRRSGRAGRRRRADAGVSLVPWRPVSPRRDPTAGRSRSVPHPQGIIGSTSARGHGDLPQVRGGDRACLWPAERPCSPTQRTEPGSRPQTYSE